MKLTFIMALIFTLFAIPAGAQQGGADAKVPDVPQTQDDKVSYAIGVQVAEGIKSQQIKVNPDRVAQGLRDALSDSQLMMSQNEIGAAIMAVQQQLKQKADQARAAALEKNKADGDAFLADNGKKDGV